MAIDDFLPKLYRTFLLLVASYVLLKPVGLHAVNQLACLPVIVLLVLLFLGESVQTCQHGMRESIFCRCHSPVYSMEFVQWKYEVNRFGYTVLVYRVKRRESP